MLSILKSGGILILPIILCGLIATFIIVERIMYFIQIAKKDKKLKTDLQPLLDQREYDVARTMCDVTDTPSAKIISKALASRFLSSELIKDAVEAESNRQLPKLDHFLTALGTIANISTLLGLLGTVTGNISAFGVLGDGGTMGNPAVLAGAIAEALVTTASGLVVSIPALIFYNAFARRANKIILDTESWVTEIILGFKKEA